MKRASVWWAAADRRVETGNKETVCRRVIKQHFTSSICFPAGVQVALNGGKVQQFSFSINYFCSGRTPHAHASQAACDGAWPSIALRPRTITRQSSLPQEEGSNWVCWTRSPRSTSLSDFYQSQVTTWEVQLEPNTSGNENGSNNLCAFLGQWIQAIARPLFPGTVKLPWSKYSLQSLWTTFDQVFRIQWPLEDLKIREKIPGENKKPTAE